MPDKKRTRPTPEKKRLALLQKEDLAPPMRPKPVLILPARRRSSQPPRSHNLASTAIPPVPTRKRASSAAGATATTPHGNYPLLGERLHPRDLAPTADSTTHGNHTFLEDHLRQTDLAAHKVSTADSTKHGNHALLEERLRQRELAAFKPGPPLFASRPPPPTASMRPTPPTYQSPPAAPMRPVPPLRSTTASNFRTVPRIPPNSTPLRSPPHIQPLKSVPHGAFGHLIGHKQIRKIWSSHAVKQGLGYIRELSFPRWRKQEELKAMRLDMPLPPLPVLFRDGVEVCGDENGFCLVCGFADDHVEGCALVREGWKGRKGNPVRQ